MRPWEDLLREVGLLVLVEESRGKSLFFPWFVLLGLEEVAGLGLVLVCVGFLGDRLGGVALVVLR
jgi:hypothetical protein